MHLVRYRDAHRRADGRRRRACRESPRPTLRRRAPSSLGAFADGRTWLDPSRRRRCCAAYGIPVDACVARARRRRSRRRPRPRCCAERSAVAVKILSPRHRPQVRRRRRAAQPRRAPTRARDAAAEIIGQRARDAPDARIPGVTVHPMIVRPKARELIAGIADDRDLRAGRSCSATAAPRVEIIDDKALALPPLDLEARPRPDRPHPHRAPAQGLSRRARSRSRRRRARAGASSRSSRPTCRRSARSTQSAAGRRDGVVALDARIAVAPVRRACKGAAHPRFAVRPYPTEWERHLVLTDGTARVRATGHAGRRGRCIRAFFTHGDSGGHAAALLRARQGLQPRLHRAPDPARLRPRHGLHRHRRGIGRDAGRRAPACRRQLRNRRIRHPDRAPTSRAAASGGG